MSQPMYPFKYVGAVEAKANIIYTASTIYALFSSHAPNAMKFKGPDGTKVTINKTVGFDIKYDDESYFTNDATTYVFTQDCYIAIGKYVAVV